MDKVNIIDLQIFKAQIHWFVHTNMYVSNNSAIQLEHI